MQPQTIQSKIYELRGQRIMFDFDLAELYQVETRVLNQSVKRNQKRFPADFMFRLSPPEWAKFTDENSSQFVMSSKKHRGSKYLPYVFTEQGVSMLSSILRSDTAVQVNISIMRAFVTIRQYALTHKELSEKLQELENRYDQKFSDVYEALNYLLQADEEQKEQETRNPIGYK